MRSEGLRARRNRPLVIFMGLATAAFWCAPAHGDVYTVSTLADGNTAGTLRDAISALDQPGSTYTEIVFSIAKVAGVDPVITLNSALGALPPITKAVNIHVDSGSTVYSSVTLNGSAIRNGNGGATADGLTFSQTGSSSLSGMQVCGFLNGIVVNNNASGGLTTVVQLVNNTINANQGVGVLVTGSHAEATIEGNAIGRSLGKSIADGNGGGGVSISAGASATITGNTVTGNGAAGINVAGAGSSATIQGQNYIGMVVVAAGGSGSFAPGTYALGNKGNGINVDGASATITGNFISANAGDGVAFTGASASSVKGNLIGTNATGTSITGPGDAFDSGGHPTMGPVSLGNGGNGVRVTSGAGVTIGGTDHASGNLISGNNGSGVYLASSNNTVIGNRIGTDATGAAPAGFSGGTRLGNEASGVDVESGSNNQIGGTSPGEGNTIAYNNVNGVTLLNGADPNPVRGNSIFSSGLDLINAQNQLQHFGLGIDIGDNIAGNIGGYGLVTPNSVSLVDGFQPFPEWLQGTFDSSQLTLTGFLPGADGSTTAFIDFYSNAQPNGTGYGEGQTYLGAPSAFQWEQLSAPAGETGQWFVATFQASEVSSAQPYFTATATSADGRTSEFSAYATAAGLPTAVPLPSSSMAILASLGGLGAISFMRRRRHASVR